MQTDEDKLWAGLGYAGLPILMIPSILIFILKRGESDYIYFHLLQALAFGLFFIVSNVLCQFLVSIPLMGLLVLPLYGLVVLGFGGIWLLLILAAFMGKDIRIPILAQWLEQSFMA